MEFSRRSIESQLLVNEYVREIESDGVSVRKKMEKLEELLCWLTSENRPTQSTRQAIARISPKDGLVELITSLAPYSYAVNINCTHDYPDQFVIKSMGHVIRVVNDDLIHKRWFKKNLYLCGFLVLERHSKTGLDALPHWHCLFRFSPDFQGQIDLEQFSDSLHSATTGLKTNSESGGPVFDSHDIKVERIDEFVGESRFADYIAKNIYRNPGNYHDQWGTGVYHLDLNGLQKVS